MSGTGATAFYVELPADEHGNTMLPKAVVHATTYPAGSPEHPRYDPARPVIVFHAPPEIADVWPWMYADSYAGWAEVPGPARMLTYAEHRELTAEIRRRDAAGFYHYQDTGSGQCLNENPDALGVLGDGSCAP